MTENEKAKSGSKGDPSADLIQDLAEGPPAKGLDTIKAASDAVDAEGGQDGSVERRNRIERRAYELWEADGGRHGSHEDFWYKAEAEIARENG